MLIMYENLDDYLELLRQEAVLNKTNPIYLSIIRPQNPETQIMSAQIYIQIIKDGHAFTYQYTDLPDIRIKTSAFFDAVFANPQEAEDAKKRYETENNELNNKINEEYNKIKEVLKGIGYTNFVKAIVQ